MDPLTTMNLLMKKKDQKKHSEKKTKTLSKEKEKIIKSTPVEHLVKNYKPKTIEQLRAERLKRESEERLKAQRLLSGANGKGDENSKNKEKIELDDRKRKYNNQFNPDYSKY